MIFCIIVAELLVFVISINTRMTNSRPKKCIVVITRLSITERDMLGMFIELMSSELLVLLFRMLMPLFYDRMF